MSEENLNFEIQFFEQLLLRDKNFKQALVALGDAYTKKGFYQKGLEIDKRLLQLKPDDEFVYYNLACDYSLLKDAGSSLEFLDKAINLGYNDFEFMQQDSDLEFVRQDLRFQELLYKHSIKQVKGKVISEDSNGF